jgi:hypothetical protein
MIGVASTIMDSYLWNGWEAGEFRSATRNASAQRRGWKKVMKPQITPAVEAVAADVHLGTTTMKSVSLPVSELKP